MFLDVVDESLKPNCYYTQRLRTIAYCAIWPEAEEDRDDGRIEVSVSSLIEGPRRSEKIRRIVFEDE